MADTIIVISKNGREKFEIPRTDLPKAISMGYFPSETAPVNKSIVTVPGESETQRMLSGGPSSQFNSQVRERALAIAEETLPGGEQFGPGTLVRGIIKTATSPFETAKNVGSGLLEMAKTGGQLMTMGSIDPATGQPVLGVRENLSVPPEEPAGLSEEELQARREGRMIGSALNLAGLFAGARTKGLVSEKMRRAASPSFERAGQVFESVKAAAGNVPVNLAKAGDAAFEIQRLAESGGQMPKVIRDFLRRATDPDKPAMTYSEARDFYSNASRLSANERSRLTPVIDRKVAEFTKSLRDATEEAAGSVGKREQFNAAMEEYRRAAARKETEKMIKDALLKYGVPAAVGTGAAYGLTKALADR